MAILSSLVALATIAASSAAPAPSKSAEVVPMTAPVMADSQRSAAKTARPATRPAPVVSTTRAPAPRTTQAPTPRSVPSSTAAPSPRATATPRPTVTSTPTPTPTPTASVTTPRAVSPAASAGQGAGLLKGVKLTPSPALKITKDGAVIENLDVSGRILVRANNVTIRNVRVRTNTTTFGINVAKGYGGTVIDHAEIHMGVGGRDGEAGVGGLGAFQGTHGKKPGDNVTLTNSVIRGFADGIKATDYSLYEGNDIQVTRSPGSRKHVDGVQGSGRSNYVIRGNRIDLGYAPGHNGAVFIEAEASGRDRRTGGIVVENNWLNGGVYTLHTEDGRAKKKGFLYDIVVRGNVFGPDYKYGAAHIDGRGISGDLGTFAGSGRRIGTGHIR